MSKVYELITEKISKEIAAILLEVSLTQEIEIKFPSMNLEIKIDSVSTNCRNESYFENHGLEMDTVYLMFEDSVKVLRIREKYFELFFSLGDWRLNGLLQVVLGTYPKKFKTDYFSQITLSQALMDEEYIYIVKNLSSYAGPGAMVRLYGGLKSDQNAKSLRRDELIERLNKPILQFDNKDWLCIQMINRNEIKNEKNHEKIFVDFINSFLMYAFTIEDIIGTR